MKVSIFFEKAIKYGHKGISPSNVLPRSIHWYTWGVRLTRGTTLSCLMLENVKLQRAALCSFTTHTHTPPDSILLRTSCSLSLLLPPLPPFHSHGRPGVCLCLSLTPSLWSSQEPMHFLSQVTTVIWISCLSELLQWDNRLWGWGGDAAKGERGCKKKREGKMGGGQEGGWHRNMAKREEKK